MAAKRDWQASQAVKKSMEKIIDGTNSGIVADKDHSDWYREVFAPGIPNLISKASHAHSHHFIQQNITYQLTCIFGAGFV